MMKLVRVVRPSAAGAAMLSAAILAGASGCGSAPSTPALAPEAFVNHRPLGELGAESPVDRTGPQYDANSAPIHHAPSVGTVSPDVQRAMSPEANAEVRTPGNPDVARNDLTPREMPTTAPQPTTSISQMAAGERTGVTTDQYQIVGSVLANVNGRPIFADQVLSTIERELMAQARRIDNPEQFRDVAAHSAAQELGKRVNDEVEFAAAEKNLGKEDQAIATRLTTMWVNNQITQAGGSEAVARQRVADQGLDFEDLKKQQYRLFMVMIFYDKRIKPLVHVSAQDERYYYEQHIRDYSVAPAARFRVIRLDVDDNGGLDATMKKAMKIDQKARAGADFAELAKANGQPNGGAISENGWMEKGAFANEALEREIWKLKPGQVTPVLTIGNTVYIAKLEDLRTGNVKSFEDPAVQDQIYHVLYHQQFEELRQNALRRLLSDSVITYNKGMEETLMAMVMQKYPEWARGNATR